MHLGGADRAQKSDDVVLCRQFRERQHDAGIGGLIVFDHELDLLAEDATGLVDGSECKFGAVLRPQPLLGGGARQRHAHADLEGRALRAGAADHVRCGNTNGQPCRELASRKLHPFLPAAGLLCRPFLSAYLRTRRSGVNGYRDDFLAWHERAARRVPRRRLTLPDRGYSPYLTVGFSMLKQYAAGSYASASQHHANLRLLGCAFSDS